MPSSAPLSKRARNWAMDLRRFQRQEQQQGHISPTDAAFLTRLAEFLDTEVSPTLESLERVQASPPGKPEDIE